MNYRQPFQSKEDIDRSPHVTIWPSSSCLVSELLYELEVLTREKLEKTVVILPTQRLCNLVLASLATKLGAFIPPRIQTLEQCIAEQSAVVNIPAVAIGDLDAEFILTELIAQKKYAQISQDHASEILQLLKEVIAEDIAPSCFVNLREKLNSDFSKSEEQISSLLKRCEELDDIKSRFFTLLRERGLELFPEFLRRSAINLTEHWQKNGYPFERTYILGFTSFSTAVFELITFAATEPRSQLWISKSPLLLSKVSPLDTLRKRFGTAIDKSEVLTLGEERRLVPVHACRNKYAEVVSCIRRVEEEINSGVAPSQIAILLTNEQEYAPLLRSLISRSEWTPNFAVSIKLAQTPIGRFLRSLGELFKKQESAAAVVDFLANPLTKAWFVSCGAELGTNEALTEAIIRSGVAEGLALMTERLKEPELQTWLLRLNEKLHLIRSLDEKNIYEASIILSQFLDCFALIGNSEWEDLTGVRESCKETLESFWKSIADVYGPSGLFPMEHGPKSIWQLINSKLLTKDVRGVGEPLYGVQVLSLSEARYVPFRRVFVLGCSEGNLPKSLPQDDLLDDYLKRSLGLSGWRNLIALEETTVMLLRDRLERLEFFYSSERVGDHAVRSRYVDQFIVDESAVLISECQTQTRQGEVKVVASGGNEGSVSSFEDYLKTISATSLEKLLHCPYRFLLTQLRVEPIQIPDASDPRLQGQWLHKVAEHFFYDLPKTATRQDFRDLAKAMLSSLTTKFAPAGFHRTWLHHHLEYFSWPRFTEHLFALFFEYPDNHHMRGDKEIRFGLKAPAWESRIRLGPYEFAVKGAIDSVDYFSKFNLITDYKRKSIPTPASIQQGLSPQLGFYLLALMNSRRTDAELFQSDNVIAGYWSILEGVWLPAFAGDSLKSLINDGSITKKTTPSAGAVLEQITKLWSWRLNQVASEKRFYADPSRCELCALAGACRRDEPTQRERLLTQCHLQTYLNSAKAGDS